MITVIGSSAGKSILAFLALAATAGCADSEARVSDDDVRVSQTDRRDAGEPLEPAGDDDPALPTPSPAQVAEAERVLFAAAVGGETGQRIDERMDSLAQTLEGDLEAATVTRVSEGIVVTIGVGILFDEGSDTIAPAALDYLARLAARLVEAPRLDLTVIGHTDRLGSAAENLVLSEQRGRAAYDVLRDQGVDPARMSVVGRGELEPIVLDDATSEESARVNRRIEIAIYAGETMKSELSTPAGDA